jgi:phospholipase C
MTRSAILTSVRQHLTVGASLVALMANLGTPLPASAEDGHRHSTATPIKHVIVIIGENRTFDHVFATYKPRRHESVSNLLSKGIVNENGTPGPNFSLASQSTAGDTSVYQLSPSGNTPYAVLPPVLAGGYSTAPFPDAATAMQFENGLLPEDYVLLTTGGTGLSHGAVDTRIPNAANLPDGPFQLTSSTHPYDTYDNSPVHRFYQMWQQFDCNAANATQWNPSGCKNDLWPWVEDTIGAGSNGNPQAASFTDTSTREGSTSMGFYNMLQGDAPYPSLSLIATP